MLEFVHRNTENDLLKLLFQLHNILNYMLQNKKYFVETLFLFYLFHQPRHYHG